MGVIGETSDIGNTANIYHNVTRRNSPSINSNEQKNIKRHPTLEDNVVVVQGQILGPIIIGKNS